MILSRFKSVGRAVVELLSTIPTAHEAGEHIRLARSCWPALVAAQGLCPFPSIYIHDGLMSIFKDLLFVQSIMDFLLALVGLLMGFEVYRVTEVVTFLQNVRYSCRHPAVCQRRNENVIKGQSKNVIK